MPDSIPSSPVCECEENTRWCDGQPTNDYTYNMDIQSLNDAINRFIVEAGLSESANVHTVNEFDIVRFNTYLEAIRKKQSWINATPKLDLPATYPRRYCLAVITDVPQMESDNIRSLIRLLEVMRDELIRSGSSRTATGINGPDDVRLTATIDKTQMFLDMAKTPGEDYVNSTPIVQVVGQGQTGVKSVAE